MSDKFLDHPKAAYSLRNPDFRDLLDLLTSAAVLVPSRAYWASRLSRMDAEFARRVAHLVAEWKRLSGLLSDPAWRDRVQEVRSLMAEVASRVAAERERLAREVYAEARTESEARRRGSAVGGKLYADQAGGFEASDLRRMLKGTRAVGEAATDYLPEPKVGPVPPAPRGRESAGEYARAAAGRAVSYDPQNSQHVLLRKGLTLPNLKNPAGGGGPKEMDDASYLSLLRRTGGYGTVFVERPDGTIEHAGLAADSRLKEDYLHAKEEKLLGPSLHGGKAVLDVGLAFLRRRGLKTSITDDVPQSERFSRAADYPAEVARQLSEVRREIESNEKRAAWHEGRVRRMVTSGDFDDEAYAKEVRQFQRFRRKASDLAEREYALAKRQETASYDAKAAGLKPGPDPASYHQAHHVKQHPTGQAGAHVMTYGPFKGLPLDELPLRYLARLAGGDFRRVKRAPEWTREETEDPFLKERLKNANRDLTYRSAETLTHRTGDVRQAQAYLRSLSGQSRWRSEFGHEPVEPGYEVSKFKSTAEQLTERSESTTAERNYRASLERRKRAVETRIFELKQSLGRGVGDADRMLAQGEPMGPWHSVPTPESTRNRRTLEAIHRLRSQLQELDDTLAKEAKREDRYRGKWAARRQELRAEKLAAFNDPADDAWEKTGKPPLSHKQEGLLARYREKMKQEGVGPEERKQRLEVVKANLLKAEVASRQASDRAFYEQMLDRGMTPERARAELRRARRETAYAVHYDPEDKFRSGDRGWGSEEPDGTGHSEFNRKIAWRSAQSWTDDMPQDADTVRARDMQTAADHKDIERQWYRKIFASARTQGLQDYLPYLFADFDNDYQKKLQRTLLVRLGASKPRGDEKFLDELPEAEPRKYMKAGAYEEAVRLMHSTRARYDPLWEPGEHFKAVQTDEQVRKGDISPGVMLRLQEMGEAIDNARSRQELLEIRKEVFRSFHTRYDEGLAQGETETLEWSTGGREGSAEGTPRDLRGMRHERNLLPARAPGEAIYEESHDNPLVLMLHEDIAARWQALANSEDLEVVEETLGFRGNVLYDKGGRSRLAQAREEAGLDAAGQPESPEHHSMPWDTPGVGRAFEETEHGLSWKEDAEDHTDYRGEGRAFGKRG